MTVYGMAFLLGVVSGLRTFMGLTMLSWAARLHWVALQNTKLAFLGYAATPYVLSVLAVGELITDTLPKTPSRLSPMPFAARLITGGFCGAALGLADGRMAAGLLAGILGAVAGTMGGAKLRGIAARAFGRDLPAALLEDVCAIGLAFFVVSRSGM